MSAADLMRVVDLGRPIGRVHVEASSDAEVWLMWLMDNASQCAFIPVAKARELAAALIAAADATDEATREAEGVKL